MPTTPWNKGRRVGPKTALTQNQLYELEDLFQAEQAWHDHALLRMAIDTMLRGGDLLRLKFDDVMMGMEIRTHFYYRQEKTKSPVVPVLTKETQQACLKWINFSKKQGGDYLFTSSKPKDGAPISIDHYRKMIKGWVQKIGLYPADYSTHSLRRTKPIYLYEQGVAIEDISILLGHKDIKTTLHYLGLTIAHAHQEALKYDIFKR